MGGGQRRSPDIVLTPPGCLLCLGGCSLVLPAPLVFSDLPSWIHRAPGPGPVHELAESKGQTAKQAGLNGASSRSQEEAGGLPGGGGPWAKAWWRSRVVTRKSRAQALAPRLAAGVLGRIDCHTPSGAVRPAKPTTGPLQARVAVGAFPRVRSESWTHWGTRQAPPPQWATLDPGPLHAARWTTVTCSTRRC